MSKCFDITLLDFNQKFRQIAKYDEFLFEIVFTSNTGSCKESRDPKKINIDFIKGTRIWQKAIINFVNDVKAISNTC